MLQGVKHRPENNGSLWIEIQDEELKVNVPEGMLRENRKWIEIRQVKE